MKIDHTETDKSGITVTGNFRKSQRSNTLQNLNCVEAAPNSAGGLSFRDSKSPDGPVLHFTPDEVGAFFAGVTDGEFGTFPAPTA